MTIYWIYDYPNWALGLGIVALFVVGSVLGLLLTRPMVRRLLGGSRDHNDVVSYVFAGIGVFYGLAMGLIAVATWEDFTAIDAQVDQEAAAMASLYRDFDGYPQPLRGQAEDLLRNYTRQVIEKDWPAHRRGQIDEEATHVLDQLDDLLMAFEPSRERERIVHAEVVRELASITELRRLRLQSVDTGLPAALWIVVLIGAVLTIVLTYLFWVDNLALHALLIASLSTFIALLIFLTAAMDNPFRGEFSVSPDAFQTVLDDVMSPRPSNGR